MRFHDEVLEEFREALHGVTISFSWIKVLEWPGNVFRERESVEALGYRCLNDLFQRVLCMAAELT
jgi:hypothetical protein